MKRILAIILTITVLSFTACGSATPSYVKGAVEGDIFTSEFANIKITLPSSDWVFASDEELSALMGITMEELFDVSQFEQSVINMKTVYDMMAQDTVTGSNIILIHENLTLSEGGTDTSDEEYLEAVKSGISTLQPDIPYVYEDIYTKDLAGQTFTVLEASVIEANLVQYYFAKKNGNFMTSFVITTVGGTAIDDIISSFSEV